ncbi:hypothetical protein [Aeromonas phage Akh-2]|nr:hypothetical protein [Aeromonas phage Akh-2]
MICFSQLASTKILSCWNSDCIYSMLSRVDFFYFIVEIS